MRRSCPECGAINTRGHLCRICGAALDSVAHTRSRLQAKLLRRTDFLAAARQNERNTRRLVILLHVMAACLGYLLGWNFQIWGGAWPEQATSIWFWSGWGVTGALLMLLVSMLWSWIALRRGDRILLRIAGAQEVSAAEEPVLHNVVEEMAIAAGLIKPRVYILETDALNAFATGLDVRHAAIGVTRGLLDTLDREELQAVIGHEMGHIVNLDIRYATAVGVLVGLIALVSDGALRLLRYSGGRGSSRSGNDRSGGGALVALMILLLFAVLAPLAARLVQMAVSRQREFLADATSVRLTRNAQGMVSALEKLALHAKPFKGANRATQHMFIVNPFRNFSERATSLMATHPPLARRIARLRNLGNDI